ncbi:MAG: leucine-rich repeat domain-containing protein, partial [Synechococcus sp.]
MRVGDCSVDCDELLSIIERAAEEGWERLDLSGRGITELPRAIGNCQNLTMLRLNFNQLTEVPAKLGNLQSLTLLRLDSNQLTEVPAELGNLQSLTLL